MGWVALSSAVCEKAAVKNAVQKLAVRAGEPRGRSYGGDQRVANAVGGRQNCRATCGVAAVLCTKSGRERRAATVCCTSLCKVRRGLCSAGRTAACVAAAGPPGSQPCPSADYWLLAWKWGCARCVAMPMLSSVAGGGGAARAGFGWGLGKQGVGSRARWGTHVRSLQRITTSRLLY